MFNITKNSTNIISKPCNGEYDDATTYNCLKQITNVLETFILLKFKTGSSDQPNSANTAADTYSDEFQFRLFTIYLQTVILSLIFTIYTNGSKLSEANIDYYDTIIKSINGDGYKLGKKYLDICLLEQFSFDNIDGIHQSQITDKINHIKINIQGEILGYINASMTGMKNEFAYFYFPYINIYNVSPSVKKQISILAPRDQSGDDVRKIQARIPSIPPEVNGSNITIDIIEDYTTKLMNVISAIIKLMGVVKNVNNSTQTSDNQYLNGGPTISYAIMLLLQIPNIITMLFILKIGLAPQNGNMLKLSDKFLKRDISEQGELCRFITTLDNTSCQDTTYEELIKMIIEPHDPTRINEFVRYRIASLIVKYYISKYNNFNDTPLSKQIIQTKIYGMLSCYPQIYYTTSFWINVRGSNNNNIVINMLNSDCVNMVMYLNLISHDRNWTHSLSPILIGDKLNNCNINVPLTMSNLSQVMGNHHDDTLSNDNNTSQTKSIHSTMNSDDTSSLALSSLTSSTSQSLSHSLSPTMAISSLSPTSSLPTIDETDDIDELLDTSYTNSIPSPDDGISINHTILTDEFNSQYNTLNIEPEVDTDDSIVTQNNNSGITSFSSVGLLTYGNNYQNKMYNNSDINKLADDFSKSFIAIIDNLQNMIKDARNNQVNNTNTSSIFSSNNTITPSVASTISSTATIPPNSSSSPITIPGSNNPIVNPSAPMGPVSVNTHTTPQTSVDSQSDSDNSSLSSSNENTNDVESRSSENNDIITHQNSDSSSMVDDDIENDLNDYKKSIDENIKKIKGKLEILKHRLGDGDLKLFKNANNQLSIQQSYKNISRQLITNIENFIGLLTLINVNIDKIGTDKYILDALRIISDNPVYNVTSNGIVVSNFYTILNRDYRKLYTEMYRFNHSLNIDTDEYKASLSDIVYGGGFTYKNNLKRTNTKTKRMRSHDKKNYYY